jgi:thiol-disulfide isomerase/thioredoxin
MDRLTRRKLLLILLLAACHRRPQSIDGTWRASLASPGGELPFTLRIAQHRAFIVNGVEHVPASGVDVQGSHVTIRFDWYDSAINADLASDGNTMTGAWTRTVPSRTARMAFRATRGEQPRFSSVGAPALAGNVVAGPAEAGAPSNVSGVWKAEFVDSDGVSPARGEFHQDLGSARVIGTFLTPTGDDRYLEGSYENGLLRLSTFDGAHAFLFQARSANGKLQGGYWSRDAYHATWTATRDDNASIPDGWKDVGLTNAEGRFRFRFPDLDGRPVALTDDRFRGKVVLVNIFGSWCPNCNDEAPLLAAWNRKYRSSGLEIVGLAYEFTGNAARDREMVRRFAERYGVEYTLLLAGVSDKSKASATLPDLTRVIAYPTTVFIGRDGKVKRIYSGFSGPGTGKHYDELRSEIESLIEKLLFTSQPEHMSSGGRGD